jgi:hypothetical protein
MAKTGDKALEKVLRMSQFLAASGGKTVNVAARPFNRAQVSKALGVRHREDDDNKTYINNVRNRLLELSSEANIAQVRGMSGNPFFEDALVDTTTNAFNYVLGKLPQTNSYSGVNRVDANKVDKLLYAAVNPVGALERAVKEGDTDIAQHVQAMFPAVYALMQEKMIDVDPKEIPYQQRAKIQRVTGVPATRVSDRASKAARSVFGPPQEKGKKVNITGPSLPTGSAIQDQ